MNGPNWCRRCVLPDTRPGLTLNGDGVCSACAGHVAKTTAIDWAARARQLAAIFERAKARQRGYDCIVPVSGGKDSTWQVVKCLEHGLRVLAVTWRTPGRSRLGQANLDNLIQLGVDHVDWSINPRVERVFTYKTLARTGSSGVPMHMALFAIPLRLAVALDIPLVVYGECPHMEYAGSRLGQPEQIGPDWFASYGILQGTTATDWIDDELSIKDLEPYFLPSAEDFARAGLQALFLGNYLPWDPSESLRVAVDHGFQVRAEGPKLGYYNYADIDCDFISVHHHFKWLKFGFTRLFDNLALEIRNGRLTRDAALEIIRSRGDQTPHDDIERLCNFLQMTRAEFADIEARFRNPVIWQRVNGHWEIPNFLIPDWNWS